MDVTRHTDPREFAELAVPLLEGDPVRHTSALTGLTGLRVSPPEDVVMITVARGGQVVGCAFRSPPWPLVLSGLPVETHQSVVDFFVREGLPLGAVLGPRDAADAFMPLWKRATGQTPHFSMGLRLHRLVEFTPPSVPGGFRRADRSDSALLGRWWSDFEAEEGDVRPIDREEQVRQSFASGMRRFGFWLAPDGQPVAMAGGSSPLHGMCRIGPVFTPKDQRGRGYGSGVTAAMTRWALDDGAREVLLYTDVANPVSNAIYHRIGYRPVLEAVEHRLRDANTLDG